MNSFSVSGALSEQMQRSGSERPSLKLKHSETMVDSVISSMNVTTSGVRALRTRPAKSMIGISHHELVNISSKTVKILKSQEVTHRPKLAPAKVALSSALLLVNGREIDAGRGLLLKGDVEIQGIGEAADSIWVAGLVRTAYTSAKNSVLCGAESHSQDSYFVIIGVWIDCLAQIWKHQYEAHDRSEEEWHAAHNDCHDAQVTGLQVRAVSKPQH